MDSTRLKYMKNIATCQKYKVFENSEPLPKRARKLKALNCNRIFWEKKKLVIETVKMTCGRLPKGYPKCTGNFFYSVQDRKFLICRSIVIHIHQRCAYFLAKYCISTACCCFVQTIDNLIFFEC